MQRNCDKAEWFNARAEFFTVASGGPCTVARLCRIQRDARYQGWTLGPYSLKVPQPVGVGKAGGADTQEGIDMVGFWFVCLFVCIHVPKSFVRFQSSGDGNNGMAAVVVFAASW